MRIASPSRSTVILVALALQACGGSSDGSVPPPQSVLQGDWVMVRTRDSNPDRMVGHDYWHFDVNGDRFAMSRSCGGATIATGVIRRDGRLVFETSASGSSLDPSVIDMRMIDNELVYRSRIDAETDGETFMGHAVQPLMCELARSMDGSKVPSNQATQSRVLPARLTDSAPRRSQSTSTAAIASASPVAAGDDLLQHLKDSYGSWLPGGTPYTGPQQGTSPTSNSTSNGNFLTTCTATPMTMQQMENTFSAFTTDGAGAIYPGALIQGRPYTSNQMIPVTLPRAPVTIVLTGPTLVSTAPSMSYQVRDPGSFANVQTAINSILDQGVAFGSADFSEQGTYASTDLQLNLSMGAAGSYDGITAGGSFSLGGRSNQSTMVFAFNQTFYTVSVDTTAFAHPLDAFTADATDPPDPVSGATQVGSGNPPLYVSSASYGRQILVAVTSSYSKADVKAALNAAFGAGGAADPVAGHASIRNSDVFSNASIIYSSRGGKDAFAQNWTAITGADGAALFKNVQKAMQAIQVEPFTTSTPAAMIGYTLKYLVNRSPAGMLYATDYVETECTTTPTANPHTFTYSFENPDYQAGIALDGHTTTYTNPYGKTSYTNRQVHLAAGDSSDHTLRVWLKSNRGNTGMRFRLMRDNAEIVVFDMRGNISFEAGTMFEWSATINPKTGKCVQTEFSTSWVHYINYLIVKNSCNPPTS